MRSIITVAVLLQKDHIINNDLLTAGMIILLPVSVFNDGFNGSSWSERIGFKNIGLDLEAVFMKKTRSKRLVYKEVLH